MAYDAWQYPTFEPAMRPIIAITNSNPAIVTTGTVSYPGGVLTLTPFLHQYISGIVARIYIPPCFGMQQLNHFVGKMTVLSTTTFSIPIDTTSFDPFIIPPIVLIPDPILGPPNMIPLPPVRKLSDGTYAQEEFSQVVPNGSDTYNLDTALHNALPW